MRVFILILLLLVTAILTVYDIQFNYDNYDILLHNRFTKLGFGIDYKEGFEIWHFAHTIHGGKAEKRLYPNVSINIKSLMEKTENQSKIEKEIAEFASQHKDFEQYQPSMYEISLRPENENLSLQELYDKAKEEDEATMNEFLDMRNINLYFKGYNTTYGDWVPLITEIDGEPVVYHDSNLFHMAYTRELEKKYNVKIDCNGIMLKDFDEYFAKRAEKDGYDILVTILIEDFYVERGLLFQKEKAKRKDPILK